MQSMPAAVFKACTAWESAAAYRAIAESLGTKHVTFAGQTQHQIIPAE